MFDGFASVIREFAFASMWLSMVRMPCRVLHPTSTNLLSFVRLWVVLQTDSDVRLCNISTDEELWVEFLRSFVFVFLDAEWSWLWSACTGTGDSTGGRAHSHGLLSCAGRLIRTVSCGSMVAWSSGE